MSFDLYRNTHWSSWKIQLNNLYSGNEVVCHPPVMAVWTVFKLFLAVLLLFLLLLCFRIVSLWVVS